MAVLPISKIDLSSAVSRLQHQDDYYAREYRFAANNLLSSFKRSPNQDPHQLAQTLTTDLRRFARLDSQHLTAFATALGYGYRDLRGSTNAQLTALLGFTFAHALRESLGEERQMQAKSDSQSPALRIVNSHNPFSAIANKSTARRAKLRVAVDRVTSILGNEMQRAFNPTQSLSQPQTVNVVVDHNTVIDKGAEFVLQCAHETALFEIARSVARTSISPLQEQMQSAVSNNATRGQLNSTREFQFFWSVFPATQHLGVSSQDAKIAERASVLEAAVRILGETVDENIFKHLDVQPVISRALVDHYVANTLGARGEQPLFDQKEDDASTASKHAAKNAAFADLSQRATNARLEFKALSRRLNHPESYTHDLDDLFALTADSTSLEAGIDSRTGTQTAETELGL